MGARLGIGAMRALGVTKAEQFYIEAVCFAKNCALDGIQYTTGCTLGNGNLSYEDAGRAELVVRTRDGRRSVTVTASTVALERLSGHKRLKAELMQEREVSGLARAADIDRRIAEEFDRLVQWVQDAPEEEVLTITREGR